MNGSEKIICEVNDGNTFYDSRQATGQGKAASKARRTRIYPRQTQDAKICGEIPCTIKPDCDNIAKIVLDALNGLAYDDDSQVTELEVHKFYGDIGDVFVGLEEIKEENNG